MFNNINIEGFTIMPTINITENTLDRLKKRVVPFEDKDPEDVIVRLLNETEQGNKPIDNSADNTKGTDLVSHAGRIPHGSKLRAEYKGREYFAEVRDGRVIWLGREYSSLSKAAVAVIQSTGTNRPTENGWRFWEVKAPGDKEWNSGLKFQNK